MSLLYYLSKNLIVANSCGSFFCRKKQDDILQITEIYEPNTVKFFKKFCNRNCTVVVK